MDILRLLTIFWSVLYSLREEVQEQSDTAVFSEQTNGNLEKGIQDIILLLKCKTLVETIELVLS
jgi:hypothetical protein